jgi:hypothetical protein
MPSILASSRNLSGEADEDVNAWRKQNSRAAEHPRRANKLHE